jgi:hypothetical protein
MRDPFREEARLIILRELHKQVNYSRNDAHLRDNLESVYGILKSREWVREELAYLERVGAVRCHRPIDGDEMVIAQLLAKGLAHLERQIIIDGVKRMIPPEQ